MYSNNIYFNLGEALKSNKIKYFVFKGSYKLHKPFCGDGDLDLFVLSTGGHASCLIKIAQKLGFVLLEKPPSFRENYTLDLFYYDKHKNTHFHLHLHTQLNFGNKIASNLNINVHSLLVEKRVFSKVYNLYILPPELDLLLLGARKEYQYGNKWFKKTTLNEEINSIRNAFNESKNIDYLSHHFSKETKKFISNLLLKTDNVEFHSLKRYLFKYRINTRLLIVRIIHKVFEKGLGISLLGKRYVPFKGKLVVLLGIDGSGKSTSIKHLKTYFEKILTVRDITLGSGQSGASIIRRIIFSIFGTKAFLKGHKKTRNNRKSKKSILYVLWILLCLRDKVKNLNKLHKSLLRGELILVDRWPQSLDLGFADAPRLVAHTKESGFVGWVARYEELVFKKISCFYPDKLIILNVSPENSPVAQ